MLEKTDRSISKRISCLSNHLLYNLLPRFKESLKHLRPQTSLLPCLKEARKGFFGCYSVCETMKDTKEGYFIM